MPKKFKLYCQINGGTIKNIEKIPEIYLFFNINDLNKAIEEKSLPLKVELDKDQYLALIATLKANGFSNLAINQIEIVLAANYQTLVKFQKPISQHKKNN